MDIPPPPDPQYGFPEPVKVRTPAHRGQGLRIRGLYADLQLHQPRAHAGEKLQLFLAEKLRLDLKMEVRNPIVMLQDISPNRHGMAFAAVEGPIHKFHLGHPSVQEKLKLPADRLRISEADALFDRGEAVAAGEGAAPAGLIVDNAVFKVRQIRVRKRKGVQIRKRGRRIHLDAFFPFRLSRFFPPPVRFPVHKPWDFLKAGRACLSLSGALSRALAIVPSVPSSVSPILPAIFRQLPVILRQPAKGLLAFPAENPVHRRIFPQKGFRVVRNLRAAQPDGNLRHDLPAVLRQFPHIYDIPDIAGK